MEKACQPIQLDEEILHPEPENTEIDPTEFLKESEFVARKASIRWGVNQSGGIPTPFVPKDNFIHRFLRIFN